MKRAGIVTLAAIVLVSCQDAGEPVSPDFPLPRSGAETKGEIIDIVDARDEDGNSRFAFGPPLTDRIKIEGAFDETAVTQVRVCELSMAAPQTCVETVWTSVEPVPVQAQGGDSRFRVDWKLTDSDVPILGGEDAPTYRVGVFIGDFRIGHVDLKFDENEVNQNLPVRYMVHEGALAEGLTACVTDGEIIDCDAVLLQPGVTRIVSVFSDNHGLAAQAEITLPSNHEPLFFLLEHIEDLTLPVGDGVPFFARATLFDTQGNEFADDINVDRFILCQTGNVTFDPNLEIRRYDNGQTTILASDPNTPECGTTTTARRIGPEPSWGDLLRGGFAQVTSVFLPQPLRALHGGLNTTGMLCCSEFDAVLVDDVADLEYRETWDWSSAEGDDTDAPAPFFTPGFPYEPCSALSAYVAEGGTGGSDVWPLGSNSNPSDITLTKTFQVPDDGAIGIDVYVGIDNDVKVILNGQDITGTATGDTGAGVSDDGFQTHENCASLDDIVFHADDSVVNIGNVNTLEIIARDRGVIGFFDARVEVVYPIVE